MNNWYVYRHIRHDKNEPFYIGIGCKKDYKRAHEKRSKRNVIWGRITEKSTYDVEIIITGLSKEEASEKEKEFIALYGRIDLGKGILCNMTDGGDGVWNCIFSEERKNKIRESKIGSKNHQWGKSPSEETRKKMSEAQKRVVYPDDWGKRMSLKAVDCGQAITTEVFNAKTGESIGIFHSMSEACRAVGLDPKKYSGKASIIARKVTGRKKLKGYTFQYIQPGP